MMPAERAYWEAMLRKIPSLAPHVIARGNPYKVVDRDGEFCVVKTMTGETVKCHPTRDQAMAHFRALEAAMMDEGRG